MSDDLTSLSKRYLDGLSAYLQCGDEAALSRAYEVGRQAMIDGHGVLEMVALHQAAVNGLVLMASEPERVRRVQHAGAYFNEALSPFEMSLRGYRVANEQLQQLNESLRRQMEETASINRELESFSYSVSHDLRVPLNGINGFSQLLLLNYGDRLDATSKGYVRHIHEAAIQMAQLIEDLLNLARVTRSEMLRSEVDLSLLTRAVCDRLHTTQPERDVKFTIEPDLHVQGDERLLGVLMHNLLGNAWKFTSKRKDARIEFGCDWTEGRPIYYVRDNGAGFDMAQAAKLFVTFSRLHTSEQFEGTGIGLAIVQRVVHRHGGQVWALGKVQGGATFFFTLEGKNGP